MESFQTRKIAEKEAQGDFGAKTTLKHGRMLAEGGQTETDRERGRNLIQHAGMLAAKEARFQGVEINGWEPEETPTA